jgi:hypothetical protein
LEGLGHDSRNDLILVDVLDGFSFLEDVLCSGVKVILECDLFRDKELDRMLVTLRRELFLMER